MIEAGDMPERNELFLENFKKFLSDFNSIEIDKVFITHGHHDHFGGTFDVLRILLDYQKREPEVYKMLDGNIFEKAVL